FFMPDFARKQYQAQNWFPSIETRFKALKGSATEQVLPARAQFLHIMGLLAGKWPHTLAIQPGGNTVGVEARTKTTLRMIIHEFRRFLEQVLFGDRLEAIIALDSKAALEKWQDQASWESSDFRRFLHLSRLLHLERLGRANDCFMSYGVYDEPQGRLFRSGIWQDMLKPLDTTLIHEDLSHAWMRDAKAPRHPFEGQTLPSLDNKDAYSWCKAPRLDGQVMEVGALARQVVDGHPMIRDLVARSGGNVQNRVIARLLELALVTLAMQRWVEELVPGQPCHTQGNMPDESRSAGMIEAARGSLGHWLRLEKGRILNYQIIAPTTWNFSPRDASGTRGALEQALIGAPAGTDEENPVSVQHIVRSFDPCMVCTVH
ncbi:MAG TPA: HupV protein, partial [Chromatiaceae bacterium]|nr:HupV protein [Chromatiaceae bacterium]